MQTIVLVSCVKSKLSVPAKAKDLYTSPLFRYNLKYAAQFNPQSVFILSAKYGLVELDHILEPYEMTLNTMSERAKIAWSRQVLAALQRKTNLQEDRFIFLAGQNYRKYLIPHMARVEIPLQGLSFGQQLQELKRRTA